MRLIPRAIERRRIIKKLAARSDTITFTCGYVDFWIVGHTETSIKINELINESQLKTLCEWIQLETGSLDNPEQLALVCIDQSVSIETLPNRMLHIVETGKFQGVWYKKMRLGVMLMGAPDITRLIILHELTHGLVDTLTHHYAFPPTLMEGLAESFARALPDKTGQSDDAIGRAKYKDRDVNMRESSYVSIVDLLNYRYNRRTHHASAKSHSNIVYVSTWFFWFLVKCGKGNPKLRHIFHNIWVKKLRSPMQIHDWLCEAGGWTPEQLEEDFRSYCLTGKFDYKGDFTI